MVVTSVVTYTFPIGPFLGAPSLRYGPSVDWGVVSAFNQEKGLVGAFSVIVKTPPMDRLQL